MKWLALLLLAACEGRAVHELPGAALAPELRNATPIAACGTDIAFADGGPTQLRYRYLYDAFGRLSFARGAYVDAQFEDTIEYRWDNLDQMAKLVQRHGWDDSSYEVEALYSTLGDLIEYTERADGQVEHHLYTGHDERGLPARELVDAGILPKAFALHYDAAGRLVLAAADDGPTTIYTYDDAARTITIDTDGGGFVGVLELDAENRQLVERWSGTDPSVIASERSYTWVGDRLERMTFRSGSEQAPLALDVVEIDTHLYNCDPPR